VSWRRLADLIRSHPRRVLAFSLAVLVAPALALPTTRVTYDLLGELPPSAESVKGFDLVSKSFPPGQVQPLILVVESDGPIWNDEDFDAIDALTVNLTKLGTVEAVRSVTRPSGGKIDQAQIDAAGLGGLADLPAQIDRGVAGLRRAIDGLKRIRGGLEEIHARLPELREGLAEALAGVEALHEGVVQIRDGLGEARDGLGRLAADVAEPTQDNLERAWEDLRASTVAKSDPVYQDLAERVGTALALVSGRCPDTTGVGLPLLTVNEQPCEPGQPIEPGYDGLSASLREVADGIGRAQDGLTQVDGGLSELAEGLRAAGPGIDQLRDGVDQMVGGLNLIIPGLGRLHRGLVVGFAQAEKAGLLPSGTEGDFALTATLVNAFPKLKEQLSFFVDDSARATRLFITLDRPPYEVKALDTTAEINRTSELSLSKTSLEDADLYLSGSSAFFSDVRDIQQADMVLIIWVVILGVFLVLVGLLRSLISPLYLVVTVLLSYGATMGIATIVFQGFLGHDALVWWLPPFLFVILVALGADYNIFLMSRIREEAQKTDTRNAVGQGLALTGHVITSAGLILAGTFAALMFAPLRGLLQIGFATTVGILLDTFVVRSLLVPSIAVLLGRHNWWPSKRAQRA
jgi:putative drug exporter of the RND superfamily